MVANHYLLQGISKLVALDRYLRWRQPGLRRPSNTSVATSTCFLRGCPAPGRGWWLQSIPGCLVETVDLARLAATPTTLRAKGSHDSLFPFSSSITPAPVPGWGQLGRRLGRGAAGSYGVQPDPLCARADRPP